MTGLTPTFSGNSVQPATLSYNSLSLSANASMSWPSFALSGDNVVAVIMDITATTGGLSLSMPDATEVGNGTAVLFNNTGANTVTIKDVNGSTLGTIGAGVVKYLYLYDNSTSGGSWRIFTFGTGTSSADASALAGYGLKAISTTLNQAIVCVETAAPITINASTSRAAEYVCTGGSVNVTLPSAGTAGDDFFFLLRNSGSGTVTLVPDGTDTVDGAASEGLNPGDSCWVFCSGSSGHWYTFGLGRSVVFAFTQLVKNVAGSTDVTLTASEAANKLITFTGALTGNINVNVPNTASPYFVFNNTTGAYSLKVKTSAGTGEAITQGAHDILVCDAVNVYNAVTNTPGTSLFSTGSVGSPSIAFVGDTATGLYSPALHQMAFTSNGSQVWIATSSGFSVTGALSATLTSAANVLTLNGNTAHGVGINLINQAASGHKNWQIASSTFVGDSLSIAISTANDGTTFAEVARLTSTGVAVTGNLTTTTGIVSTGTGVSLYTATITTAANLDAMSKYSDGTATWFSGINGANTADSKYRISLQGTGPIVVVSSSGLAVTGTLSSTGAFSVATNDTYIQFKDTGGTLRRAVGLNSANAYFFGDIDNVGYATQIRAGSGQSVSLLVAGSAIAAASSTGLAVTGLISATTTGQVGTTLGVGGATPSVSGAGITFPSSPSLSSNANTLDDYEEGTWTPAIQFGGGTTGITYSAQTGVYTKIGRLVHATFNVALSAKGSSSGAAAITGWPVAPSASGNADMPAACKWLNMATNWSNIMGVYSSGPLFLLQGAGAAAASVGQLVDTDFGNTSQIRSTWVYNA